MNITWTEELELHSRQKVELYKRKAVQYSNKARRLKLLHHILSLLIIILSLLATVLTAYKHTENEYIQFLINILPPLLSGCSSIIAYFSFSDIVAHQMEQSSKYKRYCDEILIALSQPYYQRNNTQLRLVH